MNRAERRKMQRKGRKKGLTLSDEQVAKIQSEANMEYIRMEVERRMKINETLFSEALIEAFERNNISKTKGKMLLDDISLIMRRKVAEKRNEKLKA